MSGATYRDLMARTARELDAAGRSTRVRFDDRSSALAAVADQHRLLSAITAHIWAVLIPARAAGVRAAPYPDAVEAAAVRLATTIDETVGRAEPHVAAAGGPHASWARAARTLRAATDLVLVHHGPSGAPRSPDATMLEFVAVRDAALSHLADLTLTTIAATEALELRVGQAAGSWKSVKRHLPRLTPVEDAARKLATLVPPSAEATLPNVGLLPATVSGEDIVTELGDRFLRLRQRAWELPGSRDRSIATLRDFAILGVAAHAHAAAFHSPDAAAAPLVERARHWQRLAGRLAFFRSAAPPDELVHTDLAAVAGLLRTVAPLAGSRLPAAPHPETRRAGALLNGAVRIMAEVAGENARTFAAITRTGTVYVHARSLTGEEVTDDPVLVRAHLDGKLVRAPARMLDDTGALYTDLGWHPIHAPSAHPARVVPPNLRSAPTRCAR